MVDIYDWNDLDAVRNDLTADYTLQNDLDSSTAGYAGVGDDFKRIGVAGVDGTPFSGTFNGQGFQISDFVLGDDGGANRGHGLFGGVDEGGLVENLELSGTVDVTGFSADVSFFAGGVVGGIGGTTASTVQNCVSHVDVTAPNTSRVGSMSGDIRSESTVTDCYATGSVDGDDETGGLVGANFNILENSYAVGSVTGNSAVGGLVGDNGDSIQASYAVGSVTGDTNVGGLVGNSTGTTTDSYWDTQSTGQSTSAGGTGLTTSEMQGEEASTNMGGFDFTDVWDTVLTEDSDTSADGYPILQVLDRATQLQAQGIYFSPDGIYIDGTEYDCLVDGTQYDVVQN